MNELIRYFAVKSKLTEVYDRYLEMSLKYGYDDTLDYDQVVGEFTQLIVKECITVIKNKMPEFTCKEEYDNLIRKAGRMDAIDEIEQHFGVEE